MPTIIASGHLEDVAGSPTPYYGTIILYKAAYYPAWFCFGQSPQDIWYGITDHEIYDLTRVVWRKVAFTA